MNQENIRNFVIISHIDHGKSTLADRFLELTGTISSDKMRPQFLDAMDLEREKGITIKMKPVRMIYHAEIRNSKSEILNKSEIQNSKLKNGFGFRVSNFEFSDSAYTLNLIDTPGHVDFSYEVSRALAAVEGAILLVDATRGIQAQTLANLELAKKESLKIIPVINKIDLPQARVGDIVKEISRLLKIDESEILKVSAKYGTNVDRILEAVVEKIPPPKSSRYFHTLEYESNGSNTFRALIFDSNYDSYKGVLAFVRVVDGSIEQGEKIRLFAAGALGEAKEIGYFNPEPTLQKKLSAGEIGYIATGIKEPGKVRVGDTITKFKIQNSKFKINSLPGYKEPQPMVFASLYPENFNDFDLLKTALLKLKLNDPSLIFEMESKEGLGRGFRCGFLGTLHGEIICERLFREFGLKLIISSPAVVYRIVDQKDRKYLIYSTSDWLPSAEIKKIEEPYVSLKILFPTEYIGKVSEVLEKIEGKYIETQYLSAKDQILIYETPLREIITDFYDKLKSASQGYGSMSYEILDYREGDLAKMDILIAGKIEPAFSKIVPRIAAYLEGKKIVEKLKEILPPQQFSVALQAVIDGKIVARETLGARRKDVTGYLYGGDVTRKRKLLEKQKKGKKLLAKIGKVRIPSKVFLEVFKNR